MVGNINKMLILYFQHTDKSKKGKNTLIPQKVKLKSRRSSEERIQERVYKGSDKREAR